MKCIIAGSRCISNYRLVEQAIEQSGWKDKITEVVCGDAYGVDKLGEKYADIHDISIKHFPAQWNDLSHSDAIIRENSYGEYDAKAGLRRNIAMGDYADALICVIKDDSSGSSHMIEYMQKLGKKVYIMEI
jgi:hypothetical protein